MSFKTLGGTDYTPMYVLEIDQEKCIGCGRCFKVCGRMVLKPIEKPFEDDEDEYGDDMGNMVMSIEDRDDCIGCEACARTCVKKCYSHAPG